jgi:hypothetical protein
MGCEEWCHPDGRWLVDLDLDDLSDIVGFREEESVYRRKKSHRPWVTSDRGEGLSGRSIGSRSCGSLPSPDGRPGSSSCAIADRPTTGRTLRDGWELNPGGPSESVRF